jgi:hypothetical protein
MVAIGTPTVLPAFRVPAGWILGRYDQKVTDSPGASLDELAARLSRVEASLERIEQGTYDRCSVCGHGIEEARFEEDPFATLCRSCSLHETGRG